MKIASHSPMIPSAMRLILIGLLFCLCQEASGASKVTAIQGGDLYTITNGIIRNGTILIQDGVIADIGPSVNVPKDADVIDASGKVVMPGFVTATTQYLPAAGFGSNPIAGGLNPYDYSLSLALAAGVTSLYVAGGGTDAVIKPTFGDLDAMMVKEPVFENLQVNRRYWMQKADFKQRMQQAREYLLELAAYERAKTKGEAPKKPGGIDLHLRLLKGERPGRVLANTASDILDLLELVEEFKFQLVVENAVEAWTVAEEIPAQDVTLIITPRHKSRPDEEVSRPTGSNVENAAILKRAGVKFAIVPTSPRFDTGGIAGRDLMTLPLEAAFAVSGGLDEETALEAITITPAEILGIADRVGSLQVGKDADIVILDGHPFHYNTFVQKTFVNGKLLYDKGKSTFFSHIRSYEEQTGMALPTELRPEEADALPPQDIDL